MKILTEDSIAELKSILAACKILGIEGVVLSEGQARGVRPSLDAAIISPTSLPLGEQVRIGIGRVAELEKRLAIFASKPSIEGKESETGDVSLLTLSSANTTVQFRCTNVKLMKYPKANEDAPQATVQVLKVEAQQISRAVKTMGAETVTLSVNRAGVTSLQCVDSANDRFEIQLSSPVEPGVSLAQTYLASLFVNVLDHAAADRSAKLVIGEVGSLTTKVKGHTVIIFSQVGAE